MLISLAFHVAHKWTTYVSMANILMNGMAKNMGGLLGVHQPSKNIKRAQTIVVLI